MSAFSGTFSSMNAAKIISSSEAYYLGYSKFINGFTSTVTFTYYVGYIMTINSN